MPEKINVKIAGRAFVLRSSDVVRAVRKVDPEAITSHFVVVDSRRFPPKQVVSRATGLDRADFTTHQARRTLMRLGFAAGRRGVRGLRWSGEADEGPEAVTADRLADRLRPLAGQWVAIKDEDILHAAGSAQQLVAWLARHGQA